MIRLSILLYYSGKLSGNIVTSKLHILAYYILLHGGVKVKPTSLHMVYFYSYNFTICKLYLGIEQTWITQIHTQKPKLGMN